MKNRRRTDGRAVLEPEYGEFDFGWLDEAVELAGEHGMEAVLCTLRRRRRSGSSMGTRKFSKMSATVQFEESAVGVTTVSTLRCIAKKLNGLLGG